MLLHLSKDLDLDNYTYHRFISCSSLVRASPQCLYACAYTCRQAYDRSLPLRPLDCDDHLILAAQALNVLNTYDKGFTHTQAYWLCPLQLTLEAGDGDTGEKTATNRVLLYV